MRLASAVASALIGLLLLTAGVVPAGGASDVIRPGASQDRHTTDDRPRTSQRLKTWRGSVGVIRRAVRKAHRGAPLPRPTNPRLGRQLDHDRAGLGRCDYGSPHDDDGGPLCERGDRSADRSLVVLGDSHALHWVPALERYSDQHGWSTYYLAKEACTAALVANGDPKQKRPTEPWAACVDFRDWALRQVARLQPELVVISTSVPAGGVFTSDGYADSPGEIAGPYRKGFHRLFSRLARTTDAQVVLLRDVPARAPGTQPDRCYRERGNRMRDCLSPRDAQRSRAELVRASVQVAHRRDVQVADPTGFFCWRKQCPVALTSGMLPYRNRSHITRTYARRLATPLARLLRLDR